MATCKNFHGGGLDIDPSKFYSATEAVTRLSYNYRESWIILSRKAGACRSPQVCFIAGITVLHGETDNYSFLNYIPHCLPARYKPSPPLSLSFFQSIDSQATRHGLSCVRVCVTTAHARARGAKLNVSMAFASDGQALCMPVRVYTPVHHHAFVRSTGPTRGVRHALYYSLLKY